MASVGKNKVLLLGTGFAAFRFAREIDARRFDVTVVSPRNHFLFTPLLPSTTVGTIEFRSILEPIRSACPHVHYLQAYARSLDAERSLLNCEGAIDARRFHLEFETLIIAVGTATNTFGIPGVREHALFLKEAADARAIRNRILENFEKACTPGIPDEEQAALLHFVVVGGGPTGVEFAAEMHDFIAEDLRRIFPELLPQVQVTLVEAGGQILGSFDQALGRYALRIFRRHRIKVRTDAPVVRVEAGRITLRDGTEIRSGLVVWATGNSPLPFVASLPFEMDGPGRILTDAHLQVRGRQDIYALGDCADSGSNLPATAQVAEQEGSYLAGAFRKRAAGLSVPPFRYRHAGMLAYIGGNRALADLSRVKGRGFIAFLFWRSAYLTKLVSMRNRVLVLFDWAKTALFGRDISRL